jgi:hypothetical protein
MTHAGRFLHTVRITVVVGALSALVLQGCGAQESMERRSNIKPPQPGTPAGVDDVSGIYRSIHQGLLQLRADGSYVLVVPEGPGPTSGTYTLTDGRFGVRSDECGEQLGTYDLVVTGEPKAGKATLNFTGVEDPCDDRRYYLTTDPWVYADS